MSAALYAPPGSRSPYQKGLLDSSFKKTKEHILATHLALTFFSALILSDALSIHLFA
jgi:hypothetical protein